MNINPGIRGITDRPRRAPRVGKIKLGLLVPTAKGGERPEATKYFVVPDVVAEAPDFNGELYGSEPTSLDIIFPSDDLSIVAPYNLKQYGAGTGLKCTGDGDNARALVSVKNFKAWQKKSHWDGTPETRPSEPPGAGVWGGGDDKKEWEHLPCFGLGYDDAPPCPMIESKACRSVMHLQFILPTVPGFGIWQMDIGSRISIGNILDQFSFLGQMTGGRIAGLPMRLEIAPVEVAPDGKRREVHVVFLRYDKAFKELAEGPPGLLEAITGVTGPEVIEGVTMLEIEAPDETDILTTVPEADDESDQPLDDPFSGEAPPTLIDEAAIQNANPALAIPDDVVDLKSLLRWSHGAFGLQPVETYEALEVASNGAAIIERYDDFRAAATALIQQQNGAAVMARFDDSPPLGDQKAVTQEPMLPVTEPKA